MRLLSGFIGLIFVGTGLYEAVQGSRLPGQLGWTFFPRNRPPSSQGWSSRRWRTNGLILVVWSGALLTWAIAGFTEVTVLTGLALGWLGFGIGVWVALTKLR